jgi:enamine deaminase RidA (YjgF/YER057c/UK114 family)
LAEQHITDVELVLRHERLEFYDESGRPVSIPAGREAEAAIDGIAALAGAELTVERSEGAGGDHPFGAEEAMQVVTVAALAVTSTTATTLLQNFKNTWELLKDFRSGGGPRSTIEVEYHEDGSVKRLEVGDTDPEDFEALLARLAGRGRVAVDEIRPRRFDWLDPSRYTFALGVEAGGATWVSGQTASRHDPERGGVTSGGTMAEQASVCWAKTGAVLEAAGRAPGDITELVEYVTAGGLADEAARAGARPTDRPPSVVVVESLVRPDADLEIEVVAGGPPGLVRLPQILPIDGDGRVVAPGDFVAQCAWVLEEAGRRLAGRGLGLGDVVRVVQQTTPATRRQYRDTGPARRELLGPTFPASTGILVSRLPHPEALVALDVWASTEPKAVVPYATDAYASLTFSPAVSAGGLVHVSGTTAWDPASGDTVAPDDIRGQAEFVYGEIARVCEAAGTSIERLVKTVEYVTPAGAGRYREVADVRREVLGRPFPVSTGVVVAGLLGRSWQLEVEAVAALP